MRGGQGHELGISSQFIPVWRDKTKQGGGSQFQRLWNALGYFWELQRQAGNAEPVQMCSQAAVESQDFGSIPGEFPTPCRSRMDSWPWGASFPVPHPRGGSKKLWGWKGGERIPKNSLWNGVEFQWCPMESQQNSRALLVPVGLGFFWEAGGQPGEVPEGVLCGNVFKNGSLESQIPRDRLFPGC